MVPHEELLAAVAVDGSPAQAYASHRARAAGIARYFATTRPLSGVTSGKATEDATVALIAHLHMVQLEPRFAHPVEGFSAVLIPQALHRMNAGNGEVGTTTLTDRDYDMAIKGLVPMLYRYREQLAEIDRRFIMEVLIPPHMTGGHEASTEVVELVPVIGNVPESENHLLMIESSRYLINQLRHDASGAREHDNVGNGLSDWLLGFMQTIAQHDFLEFNSSPYARMALHPLLNLHEFAREKRIRDAAQILLDYTMIKYAVSSNRGRRVRPFRRQQHRINHQANEHDFLYAEAGDQTSGFFLA